MTLELFWRFAVISALAFGGGQAALPLVERTAVAETGWITPQDFSTALAFSFITPGPVLVLATFIGYRVDGLAGAAAATLGVFLLPWGLAAAVAWQFQRFSQHPWLRGFARGAGASVIGLLLVTASSIAQSAFAHWGFAAIAAAALVLAVRTKLHPFLILLGGAAAGGLIGMAL